jgi:hypothetical protein
MKSRPQWGGSYHRHARTWPLAGVAPHKQRMSMEMNSSEQRQLANRQLREHISGLVVRYPNISEAETAEIIRFLKKGPLLDTGMLSSNEHIKPKLRQFIDDHAKEFAIGIKGVMIVILVVLTVAFLGTALWDIGEGP